MSSNSIHHAVCMQREGAAHVRDRLTLLVEPYSRTYDYLIINQFFKALPFSPGSLPKIAVYL